MSRGDELQDRGILTQQRTVIEADQRDEPEWINFQIVLVTKRALGLGVDFDELSAIVASFVKRNPARQ